MVVFFVLMGSLALQWVSKILFVAISSEIQRDAFHGFACAPMGFENIICGHFVGNTKGRFPQGDATVF